MKNLFICLANSKKYGERCIAGILVEQNGTKGLNLIRDENKNPKWIRPVTDAQYGEVQEKYVKEICMGNLVEMESFRKTPKGYQSENVFFDQHSIKKIKNLDLKPGHLDKLVTNHNEFLFNNAEKFVTKDEIEKINHSLVFIKVSQPEIRILREPLRVSATAKFNYNGNSYHLPITDVNFVEKYLEDKTIINGVTDFYFTISLGVCYEGKHFKLIAGIIYLKEDSN